MEEQKYVQFSVCASDTMEKLSIKRDLGRTTFYWLDHGGKDMSGMQPEDKGIFCAFGNQTIEAYWFSLP